MLAEGYFFHIFSPHPSNSLEFLTKNYGALSIALSLSPPPLLCLPSPSDWHYPHFFFVSPSLRWTYQLWWNDPWQPGHLLNSAHDWRDRLWWAMEIGMLGIGARQNAIVAYKNIRQSFMWVKTINGSLTGKFRVCDNVCYSALRNAAQKNESLVYIQTDE